MSPMVRQPLTTEHILLGYIAERPMYGYELHQKLANPQGLGGVWHIKQSQLYALLGKLAQDGLLSETVEQQEPRPARKIYALTARGQATLERWLTEPVPHARDLRLDFLAKLFFAQRRGPAAVMHLVQSQREQCQHWLTQAEAGKGAANDGPYQQLVRAFRVGQLQAMMTWLDSCAAMMEQPP